MSTKRIHHQQEGPDNVKLPRYWRRAHHDWRFWIALSLMLLAITIYILSDNLRFLPHG